MEYGPRKRGVCGARAALIQRFIAKSEKLK